MFSNQAISAYRGAGTRGRRRGPVGFSAMGELVYVDDAGGSADVAAIQTALNASYSPSGTVLSVDGILGPKTLARIAEFKSGLGYPATSNVDLMLLTALGVSASADGGSFPGATTGIDHPGTTDTSVSTDWWTAIYDALTLKGLSKVITPSQSTQQAVIDAATLKVWRDAAKTGSAAALKSLSDNGDLLAKLAIGLGVGYSTALAIALGGGGIIVLMFLMGGKRR